MEHALKLLAKRIDPVRVLDQFSHRLTNKSLHAPTPAMALAAADREEFQALVSRLLRRV